MSIDWITVAAQIANFLVLVWLLRRFLYRPILDGIDAREAEITERMQEAGRAKEKAEATESEYREQLKTLKTRQSDMADAVRLEAEKQRDALLVEAHKRMAQERETWHAHLDEETRKYTAKLQSAGGEALLSLTRKALTDLADETLESRIAHHLAKRIEPMTKELRSAAGDGKAAVITSRDALPQPARDDLSTVVLTVFPDAVVRFETNAEQPPGIILRVGGAQLDWTVDAYIDSLADLMAAQLTAEADVKEAAQ